VSGYRRYTVARPTRADFAMSSIVTVRGSRVANRSAAAASTLARGGAYSDGAPKAAFDYQQRYLRDFFAGHFAVTETAFITAELVNSRHDPALAHLREDHERSYALAIDTARMLGKEY
jgi:hypothetical protein